jgi:hypothetical protein
VQYEIIGESTKYTAEINWDQSSAILSVTILSNQNQGKVRYPLGVTNITPITGYTKTSDNPPVANGHNNAETFFNFTNLTESGQIPPAIATTGLTLNQYSFGDTLNNPLFKRELSDVAEDRHALFRDVLTGECLEKANFFFANGSSFTFRFPVTLS